MASITKRGKSYRFKVSAGYDAAGNQIVKTKTWTPPANMSEKRAEKEAHHQAALFEEQIRRGEYAEEQRLKFQTFVEERWFPDYASVRLRPRTIAGYKDLMQRIFPEMGHLYLDQIRPAHLARFYRKLSGTEKTVTYHAKEDMRKMLKGKGLSLSAFADQSGISRSALALCCDGKNISRENAEKVAAGLNAPLEELFEEANAGETLSANTVAKYHRVLSSVFQTAVEWQYITSNPCERVAPPRSERTEPEYLTAEQAVHLLELAESQPIYYRTAVLLLLYTGCRRGEALGLTWSDVDLAKKTISISRSTQYLPGKGTFTDETKNRSSCRVISVSETVVKALRELKLWQTEERLKLGSIWKDREGKLFVLDDGTPIQPNTLSRWFHTFIEKTDLPKIHLHSLRHTCATLNITNGVAVNVVAGQLGHATAETTTRIYTHTIQSAQAAAAEQMDDLLRREKQRQAQ